MPVRRFLTRSSCPVGPCRGPRGGPRLDCGGRPAPTAGRGRRRRSRVRAGRRWPKRRGTVPAATAAADAEALGSCANLRRRASSLPDSTAVASPASVTAWKRHAGRTAGAVQRLSCAALPSPNCSKTPRNRAASAAIAHTLRGSPPPSRPAQACSSPGRTRQPGGPALRSGPHQSQRTSRAAPSRVVSRSRSASRRRARAGPDAAIAGSAAACTWRIASSAWASSPESGTAQKTGLPSRAAWPTGHRPNHWSSSSSTAFTSSRSSRSVGPAAVAQPSSRAARPAIRPLVADGPHYQAVAQAGQRRAVAPPARPRPMIPTDKRWGMACFARPTDLPHQCKGSAAVVS